MPGTALLVGGMQSRVEVLRSALVQLGWQVVAHLNPKEAIESLSSARYEAVFCDEQLRGASAAGMLVFTRRTKPELPFYLFSNDHDPSRFKLSGEPTSVFHFPPILAQLPAPAGTPHPELSGVRADMPLSGSTQLVPLADLLEMMSVAQQQGVVELGYGKTGLVVVGRGRLEHAVATIDGAQRGGLQALAALLNLPDTPFRVAPYRPAPRSTINLGTATALAEAARIADDARRLGLLVQDLRAQCPEATAVATGHPASSLPFVGYGDLERLSKAAKQIAEAHRAATGRLLQDALLVSQERVLVLGSFGDGNLLAAEAPAEARARLYRAVQAALRALAE